LEHFEAICHSPSQIYHSALPLSPSSSWVRRCYSTELSGEVEVVKGLPAEWRACFRTVIFDSDPLALASWKDIIAVGLVSGEIIILNGTTGSQTAILSGHTDHIRSLTFSSDGTSLVSGSYDGAVKLWDVQTGGVVKAFYPHIGKVLSVSISADCTTIVSGSTEGTIHLWNIQMGEFRHIRVHQVQVRCVSFSPIHSHCFVSACGNMVQQWDIDGHQINPSYSGSNFAFSSDGTQLILCEGADIVIQNSGSGVAIAKFHIPNSTAIYCCFSPDGRLVAVATQDHTVYIWDITGSDPHLVETFVGHTISITSLVFSSTSSLITSAWDRSVKFWQIGTPSVDAVVGNPKSTSLASTPIKSVTLHAKDGVYVSSDSGGMVKIWDISTGLCRTSLQTPAKNPQWSDVQLVNGRLIFVWYVNGEIHILDVEKEQYIQKIGTNNIPIEDIRMSGDGCQVFHLEPYFIGAWSTWTGEYVGKIKVENCFISTSLIVSGPRVWACSPYSLACDGWEFGILGSSSCQLPKTPLLHLSDTKLWDIRSSRIKDIITGKVVLQLGGRFAKPIDIQLDGQYFLARYQSGEVMILDFNHVLLW